MELGNGFWCTAAQICPAQNLSTDMISQSFKSAPRALHQEARLK